MKLIPYGMLALSYFTLIQGQKGYKLSCDRTKGGSYLTSYNWNALRNATAPRNLPHLDYLTVVKLQEDIIGRYTDKVLLKDCFLGALILRFITLFWDERGTMENLKMGVPWTYFRQMFANEVTLSRLMWSHWNLFGVLHRFLNSLPELPMPHVERKSDKVAVELLLANNGTEFPSSLIEETMVSEDLELRAAAHLLRIRDIVSESMKSKEEIRDVSAWKLHQWHFVNGTQDLAQGYILSSWPSWEALRDCDGEGVLNETLPACWPPNAWGGRLVIPLLDRMGEEWISSALQGQGSNGSKQWTSAAMKRFQKNYLPHQADFIFSAFRVDSSMQVLRYPLRTIPVTRNNRMVLSTTEDCWANFPSLYDKCCHTADGEAQCFDKDFSKDRCCDDTIGGDAYDDDTEEPVGTWATVLFARDEASAQLQSEIIEVLAYQIRGIEGSRHRPFVALTDRKTLDVLSSDIHVRLLEQGITLKTVSKTILDLEDPRFPPDNNVTDATMASYWHKLYLWDPSLWDNHVPVFYLDSDTLPVHKYILEVFSLPPTITLAMGCPYPFRNEDDNLDLNAGVMVVHPNHLVFALIANKILSGWGFPTRLHDQTWLDEFFRHFSVRHEMKVPGPHWDVWYKSALNDIEGHMITSRWEPLTLDLIPPHITLPSAYDLMVDAHHSTMLLGYSEGGLYAGFNPVMLSGLGYGTDRPSPRLFHYAGSEAKPWHRCSKLTRSVVDVMWWQAHTLMCSKSAYKPCYLECDQ